MPAPPVETATRFAVRETLLSLLINAGIPREADIYVLWADALHGGRTMVVTITAKTASEFAASQSAVSFLSGIAFLEVDKNTYQFNQRTRIRTLTRRLRRNSWCETICAIGRSKDRMFIIVEETQPWKR
jgi:hypothetical protein